MTSSENNLDSNNGRPFVVHTVAQQPYPSFWYQNPAYNPFCVPGAGSRNGSLYFPCSVVPSEYPGFLVPQSPLPTTLNRRPGFPMCYHPAQFWHYSGYARKMKTQETQTELQQENMSKKQDLHSKGNSRDIGRVTSFSTNSDIESDNIPEETDGAWSSVAQKRELHAKSSPNETLCGDTPQGSYASENKKMMEEGKGSLVIQFWKTFQETVHLYDLVYGRSMPENVQHNRISRSSCESLGVPSNPQEGEDPILYKGEQIAVGSEQCQVVRHDEMLKSGLTMETDKEKKGHVAVPQILPPPDEVKDGVEIHNTLNSDLYPSSGDVTTCHERPLCISMEAVKDLSLQSRSQKTLVGERKPDNSRGSHGFPEKVDEEEVGEQNSYSQGAVPSAAWLAQFEKVDEAIQCDSCWWQDAELERCLESSTEGSGKGTGRDSRP
ncbi:uncharacterized protein LOC117012271 isoform X1 [Rhinolophus ferrumequinum]|uniref:uncharacterized protein LOC117012271 isoform X1 n=2 Tax=Rhinolophus ferrumequinum TaxID=59479 RepID=UPI00140F9C1F|nr:uncharacterized protein LOC117012271 isoform X1 [Rhinolophus ferrumequinum]XP_032944221.1 uncharacterized protein LOC117012271 isoform X1 [Rhinolophus ferrumequinum]